MNILGFGAFLETGKYQIHSRFNHVHNYSNHKEIISLVTENIGNGPNNIVLDILPKQPEKNLIITTSSILIGSCSFPIIKKSKKNNSNIFIENITLLLESINTLILDISKKISEKSLGFLLFPDNDIYFQTSFERAMIQHVKNAVNNISISRLPDVVKSMKGVGPGLTPSGDDFNCGLLYAIHYLNSIIDINLDNILTLCYHNALGHNLISNTFLRFAYLNQFYDNFHNLLSALRENDSKSRQYFTDKIINSGHTSGSDLLTGFIFIIKGVLNDQKHC